MTKMRVLLSCYAFSPYRGSESSVGWNIAKELAKHCDVTVICGDVEEKREVGHDLERWHREGNRIASLHFAYVGPTKLIALIEKLHHLPGCWAMYYLAYRLWQKRAYKLAMQLHRENPFDLVHHVTMIGYREPGYMWKLPIPFVWGPVGGAVNEPMSYCSIYSNKAKINVIVRNIINGMQKYLLLRPRFSALRAAKIWVVTPEDAKMVHRWGADCSMMIEAGANPDMFRSVRKFDGVEKLRIVWSGTHTYGKALPILIKALARVRRDGCENLIVSVLGTGSETSNWKSLSNKYGVNDLLEWKGKLSHADALEMMQNSHLLISTSVKEATSMVIIESISMGLPVVCHDACGMGIAVNDTCGIKVPMMDPSTSINGFAEAIKRIIDEPEIVERMSIGALKRAAQLTWKTKVDAILGAYEQILDAKAKI